MIINNDLKFTSISGIPNSDWSGKAKYIVDDNSELAQKIRNARFGFEPIEDKKGKLIDIKEIIPDPPEPSAAEKISILSNNLQLTNQSVIDLLERLLPKVLENEGVEILKDWERETGQCWEDMVEERNAWRNQIKQIMEEG